MTAAALESSAEASAWAAATKLRYLNGEWRASVFRDLVLDSIQECGGRVLDIGCGHGFDDCSEFQSDIAERTTHFEGIEPDAEIPVPPCFQRVSRCFLEDADLPEASFDVAYSAFVLEHVADPQKFWAAVHRLLRPGGVFWGFTVDRRHPFRLASEALEVCRLKDLYLTRVQGRRGNDRYENYPTFYRANSPHQVQQQTQDFQSADFLSLHRPGQLDYYVPRSLRTLSRLGERLGMKLGIPGSILVVRLCR